MKRKNDNSEVLVDQAWRAGVGQKDSWKTMRVPLVFLGVNTQKLNGVDIAVSGVPFDSAVTNRPGCRLGPELFVPPL